MEWVLIIEMVMAMIQQCQENRDRDDIERGLNKPGVVERLALIHVLRNGEFEYRGRKLKKKTRKYFKRLKNSSKEDIATLMARVPTKV